MEGARGKGRRPKPPPEVQVQPWHAISSDEETRALYQSRLALFAKISTILSVTLMTFITAMYAIYPETKPRCAGEQNLISYPGFLLLIGLWFVFLRGHRQTSLATLRRLDVFFVVVFGVVFGIDAVLSVDKPANMYSTMIFSFFVVFARVLYVPSTARRTAWVSALAASPMTVAAIIVTVYYPDEVGYPIPALVGGTTIYAGLGCVIASVGSHVIYGLRREVREARQLGQYTLGEKIGEGGMGAVFKATHAMLRRPTAIKLLLPGRAGEDHLSRFEREVQLTAQLTHPNTIAIYDYGRSPDGTFYYAMEYLDGVDLERLVRIDGPQPAARVVHILVQACGALAEAHARGLIHRDIKPANIILSKRGDVPDVVKVVDFGLVKDFEKESETTGSVVAGTPAYLSPEAVTSPTTIGPAGDLYAIGALAYFLLTGTIVFEAENVVEMCVHHVRTKPTPPSERTDNEIPASLEALVLQCLSKKPEDRPDSADALRRALLDLPEVPPWPEHTALEWWRSFETRASGKFKVLTPQAPTMQSPITMTIDLRGRAGPLV